MKDKELEEQIEAIRRDWVDELLQANAVEFDKEIKYLIAQERRKAKIEELVGLLEFISYDEGFEPRQLLQDRLAELKEDKEA